MHPIYLDWKIKCCQGVEKEYNFKNVLPFIWVGNLEVIEQLEIFHHYLLIEKENDKYVVADKKYIILKMWTYCKTKTR